MRSGISGWVIGLLIRGRAGAERRAANSWSPVLAAGEARRRFAFLDFEIGGGGRFANRRSQQLAFGCGPRSWNWPSALLLESAREGGRVNIRFSFHARARAAPRPAVSMRATRSYGVGFGASRSKPLAEGLMGVCALWHFRLGDRALDPWACGRRTARGEFLVAGAGRRRGPPPLCFFGL